MKTKFLILALIITGAFVLATWVGTRMRSALQKDPTQQRTAVFVDPPPRTIGLPPVPRGAIFRYAGGTTQFPASLPVYRVPQFPPLADLREIADAISLRLGFTGAASVIVNRGNIAYLQREDNQSFDLTQTEGVVAASYQRRRGGSAPTVPQSLESAGANFLRSIFPLPSEISLVSFGPQEEGLEGLVVLERPLPRLASFAWGFSLGGYSLLTPEYGMRWGFTVVDERGVVRSASYVFPPGSFALADDVALISLSDAITNLNGGRGVLLGVAQENAGDYGVPPSFHEGTLTSASLVYVFSGSTLRPSYFFSGEGTTADGQKQMFEALVLASP